ncbi:MULTISPECIES: amidohydrolase family protein [Xanthomonas]|uniref:Amidohydrolase n=1 Tax=Xanthomonas cucurbitae TaxID=56453 RepID=A0A2S7DRF7_9XANT|nr:amidohydrolase family protein [Xanthomonas cucurbitae]PPU76408.1 amidohydrolase [Xanthomonas cucurbitae]QHG85713.1 amidohydrolase [Xanthomonas cucurbitae]WDM67547.1 amidohydrolase family protein [Xanthomonas cucurbitae]WDM71423.1 amidohydrolase family protein [Xanthomonas cucurbitae]WDM75601.1 amidohydrolase family protein [Xanthomonas cucurbitae]
MNRVDAHLHFWHLARGDYGWLTPALAPLYRDFAPHDVSAALDAAGVGSVVVVQAAATEAETCYLFELARDEPRIAGVVGWVDFAAPDAAARIDALVRAGGGLLKGLRPMVQDIADVQWLASADLDAAFDAMLAHELAFDALIRAAHVPALQARLQRHPGLRVVVDHGGKPQIAAGEFVAWAAGMAALAQSLHVHCKLSGLLTEAARGAGMDALEPYVAHLFARFGAHRLLWGSDWPVLTQRAEYAQWLGLAQQLVTQHAPGHTDAVFGDNARTFYRLPRPAAPTYGTSSV